MKNRRSSTHRRAGVSLVEMLIGLTVGGFLVTMIMTSLSESASLKDVSVQKIRIEGDARRAMEHMVIELRGADRASLSIIQQGGHSKIEYALPTGMQAGLVTWSDRRSLRCVASTHDSNQNGIADDAMLIVDDGRTVKVLAHHVVPGGFRATLHGSIVNLTLELELRQADGAAIATRIEGAAHLRNSSEEPR